MQVWSCSSSVTQKHGSGFRGQGGADLYGCGWGQTGRLLREAQCNLHLQVTASRQPEDTQRKRKVCWSQSPSLPAFLSGSDMRFGGFTWQVFQHKFGWARWDSATENCSYTTFVLLLNTIF